MGTGHWFLLFTHESGRSLRDGLSCRGLEIVNEPIRGITGLQGFYHSVLFKSKQKELNVQVLKWTGWVMMHVLCKGLVETCSLPRVPRGCCS